MTEFLNRKENKWALIGTGIIWLLILTGVVFLPGFNYESKYKTIQITLQDIPKREEPKVQQTPKVEKNEVKEKSSTPAASASSSAPSKAGKKTQEKPAAAKTKPKTDVSKPAVKKPAAQQAPSPQVRQSIEEQMAEMQKAKTAKKNVDWDSMFSDDEEETSSSAPVPLKAKSLDNALSGSSATSTSTGSGAVSSKSNDGKSTSTKASNSTSNALNNVMNAKKYTATSNGVSSTIQASSVNGQNAVPMTDGSARVLISPKELKFYLSEKAAAQIDATKNVTITFRITADGHVTVNTIKISPASILGRTVEGEIIEQISKFLFSPGASEGTAKLEYTIKKN